MPLIRGDVLFREGDVADSLYLVVSGRVAIAIANPIDHRETVVALMDSTIATPEAIFALDNLSAALTTERLNQMLNQILNNGADPVVVANAFVDTI